MRPMEVGDDGPVTLECAVTGEADVCCGFYGIYGLDFCKCEGSHDVGCSERDVSIGRRL